MYVCMCVCAYIYIPVGTTMRPCCANGRRADTPTSVGTSKMLQNARYNALGSFYNVCDNLLLYKCVNRHMWCVKESIYVNKSRFICNNVYMHVSSTMKARL